MAQFKNMYKVELNNGIAPVVSLKQIYYADVEANCIGVIVTMNGEPFPLSGTCTGSAILADGSTVPLTGAIDGNQAYIDLNASCYAVEGQIQIYLKITTGGVTTTLLSAVGTVRLTETETVIDPGEIIPSVSALITAIEDAVESIPADYTALLETIAPLYANLTFPVKAGQWCWYSGVLYEANQDISTSENWTAEHWATTTVGGELATIESRLDGIQIVSDRAGLADSTADKVLVLHDDSDWGTGGPCWFEKSATWSTYGYQRSDNSYVFPVPNQAPLPEAHAPREQLVDIMQTWIGNLNLHHGDNNQFDNDLFGPRCERDSSNLFCMDCSAFVCAVLLGIKYSNSRYVLGENADNIEMQYMSDHIGPSKSEYMPKGGLQTSEIAMWFAQHGRLFDIPQEEYKVRDTLKFGDILFGCNSERKPSSYYNIEHCMFVLGTSKDYIVVAESSSAGSLFEPQGLKLAFLQISGTLANQYMRVFARPNYHSYIQTPAITPYKQGTFKYNAFLLPVAQIRRLTDSTAGSSVKFGELYTDSYSMATPDYLPIVPGSSVKYVGAEKNSANVYYNWRIHEYDETLTIIKSTTLAYYNTSGSTYVNSAVTLTENTKYVRFSENHYSTGPNTQTARLAEIKAFKFEIVPPYGDLDYGIEFEDGGTGLILKPLEEV